MIKTADALPLLQAQFGSAISTDTAALSIAGMTPLCVAAPADAEQISALIKFAAAHKIPVVPCGAGVHQGTLAPPQPNFMLLKTMRLDRLLHHEPGDMVATVQAGMSVAEFQKQVNARGQWLAIDAPSAATVGGIVAANVSGPRALGYGTLRDMVLGMSVINGDGVLRKCGGKVVKNVTGYALDKLYIGSQGTLGVITEVTFKLRPLPIGAQSWSIHAGNLHSGVELLQKISAKNLPLDMLQLSSRKPGFSPGKENCPTLSVFACGTPAELTRIDFEIRALLAEENRIETAAAGGESPEARARVAYEMGRVCADAGMLGADWLALRGAAPAATLRFGCTPSQLSSVLTELSAWQHMALLLTESGGALELSPITADELQRITSALTHLGVNYVLENLSGIAIQQRWGPARPDRAIMSGIKAALDPQGILNAGRFVI